MKYIITDWGKSVCLSKEDDKGKYTVNIPRYGVWETDGDYITNCIEANDDVNYLMNKFNTLDVLKILDK